MKSIGTAILTALQAQHKTIEDITELVEERRYKANLKGTTTSEWISEFWNTFAVLKVKAINKEINK